MSTVLNEKEAYIAMFKFLDNMYDKFGNNTELGAVLGSMSFAADGTPIDSALWNDWLQAIQKVKAGDDDISLKLIR